MIVWPEIVKIAHKNKAMINIKYLKGTYILMLLVIFVLPFYSHENYTILKNTTSHLGAQNTPNSWIMNITFILLGVTSIWTGWRFLGQYWFQKAARMVFGISLGTIVVAINAQLQKN